MSKGPVLIDLEDEAPAAPETAPAVPDLMEPNTETGLQKVAAVAARKPSVLARWFWSLLVAIIGFVASLAAWEYVTGLLARAPVLGIIITVLLALFCCVLLAIALKELSAFARLRRVDSVQQKAAEALAGSDLKLARQATEQMARLYSGRDDLKWGRETYDRQKGDQLDAEALLTLAEQSFMDALDARASKEVEAAARQVATVTAIVPLALADVLTALTANVRMIRRIAEIYGGRSGTFGSWRLTRTVLSHLVATGAVAVGDDLIGSVAGGGVLSKVSRRFGEGVINGALTARVGVAAIEVCRPLPFHALDKPSVTGLVKSSMTGLFARQ